MWSNAKIHADVIYLGSSNDPHYILYLAIKFVLCPTLQ